VGDEDYEISSQRLPSRPQTQLTAPREESAPVPVLENGVDAVAPPELASTGPRENGQRFGVRFRRGSRAPLRPGEIPLIGVVQIEPPPEPEPPAVEAAPAPAVEEKRPRARRAPRKRAASVPAVTGIEDKPEESEPQPARRPRSRSRKKAE
jgi:hypothetical protein